MCIITYYTIPAVEQMRACLQVGGNNLIYGFWDDPVTDFETILQTDTLPLCCASTVRFRIDHMLRCKASTLGRYQYSQKDQYTVISYVNNKI